MDANKSEEISVADYLLQTYPHIFQATGSNPYWRKEKAVRIVKRLLRDNIVYRPGLLLTDAKTKGDIEDAINEWYPKDSQKKQRPRKTRITLHGIFTKVVQEKLNYDGKKLFNEANTLRKNFVSDPIIQQCLTSSGDGKSRRYHIIDAEKLEKRVEELIGMDKELTKRIGEVKRARKEAERAEKESSKITVSINNQNMDIYPQDFYSSAEALEVLRLVHGGVFSEIHVNNIVNRFGEDGKLKGKKLVEIVNKTDGIMVLSSTSVQRRLENRLSLSYVEISKALRGVYCSKYVHTYEGVVDEPFILKPELDDLCQTIDTLNLSNRLSVVNRRIPNIRYEKSVVLREIRDLLDKEKKCPKGRVYEKLLTEGVLDESSVERIRDSYGAFARAMEGFYFFDFNIIRNRLCIGWEEFKRGPMKHLIELGLVRDIVDYLGFGEKGASFYVLRNGKKEEVYKILNLGKAESGKLFK